VKISASLLGSLTITLLGISGCASNDALYNEDVTAYGTVPLDKIRIGTPEMVLKEAKITFSQDESAAANAGGKRQYLSREKTRAGGQYVVQCLDESVFEIDVIYKPGSITKQGAEEISKKILPAELPARLGVETIRMDGKAQSRITYGLLALSSSNVNSGVAVPSSAVIEYRVEMDLLGPGDARVDKVVAVSVDALLKAQENKKVELIERAPLVDEAKTSRGLK
jgi:hypothetical protein